MTFFDHKHTMYEYDRHTHIIMDTHALLYNYKRIAIKCLLEKGYNDSKSLIDDSSCK